ncbi:MAG: flagellar basal-body rod protein FlgF [Gemmatales bacterium]|nr:MAG: flagellar basal-body rod protein FlgF [Gemmatales bacterium]
MIRGLYSAATGMNAGSLRQDVIAENLAHYNVPGYRQQDVVFESFQTFLNNALSPTLDGGLLGTTPAQVFFNFTPGPLKFTGNPLDLAAVNDAFFVLEGRGQPVFTRDGAFQINAAGEIVNASGLRVLGDGGPIVIPQGTRQIQVSADGFVFADGQQIGRLQLEIIENPAVLQRIGPALFTGPPPNNPPAAGTTVVEQGFREESNVEPVSEMASMIATLRFYDASERALRSISDAIRLQTQPGQNAL